MVTVVISAMNSAKNDTNLNKKTLHKFDTHIIMLSDKQCGIKYHFLGVSGIEHRSPESLVNTIY